MEAAILGEMGCGIQRREKRRNGSSISLELRKALKRVAASSMFRYHLSQTKFNIVNNIYANKEIGVKIK